MELFWFLFHLDLTTIPLPQICTKRDALSRCSPVFLHVPSEVCEETTAVSYKLPLYLWPQGALHILTSAHLAFINSQTIPA